MAYVKKIIGSNEHIIGIARLHWIYLSKGLFGFLICLTMGLTIDAILFKALTLISDVAPSAGGKMLSLTSSWVTPLFVISGGFYFLLYLVKVLYTEIALTEKRLIHKSGFIFVKINEIDIEEISGENMDMGYFGSLLGYGYIMLDCRFVGDVKLPAIGKANNFVKALHAARTRVTASYPDVQTIARPVSSEISEITADEKPAHEMLKPREPKPVNSQKNENDALTQPPEQSESEAPAETAAEYEQEKEILQLQITKLQLEVKLKETESIEPESPSTPPPAAPTNLTTAQSEIPAMTRMPAIAQDLIPDPDGIKKAEEFSEKPLSPKAPPDEERLEPTKTDALMNSFGSVAFVFKSMKERKCEPAI